MLQEVLNPASSPFRRLNARPSLIIPLSSKQILAPNHVSSLVPDPHGRINSQSDPLDPSAQGSQARQNVSLRH